MAKWANVEFRDTTKYCPAWNALSPAADLLVLWDFFVSLICGELASTLWPPGLSAVSGAGENTLPPQIVIGSLALALALRSRGIPERNPLSLSNNLSTPRYRNFSSVVFTFIAVAVSSQLGYRSAQVWIIAWLFVSITVLLTVRWILGNWLVSLAKSSLPRQAATNTSVPGPHRLFALRTTQQVNAAGFRNPQRSLLGLLCPGDREKSCETYKYGSVDTVLLTHDTTSLAVAPEVAERPEVSPSNLVVCGEHKWSTLAAPDITYLADLPIEISENRTIDRRQFITKTVLDKAGAAFLLLSLLPLIASIAVLIATTSPGPVIFRQTRQGWRGTHFTVFKFRTMYNVPDKGVMRKQTEINDPRCTRVGRLLRRTSLDEIPQLWNVLRGDMSLVGPRPHAGILDDDDRAGYEIVAEYEQRCRMKPGITGWAQVHDARGAVATVEQLRRRVAFDLYYIEHWSLWLDLRILARTPFCMVGKNVF